MTFRGTIRDGKVELSESVDLPDGTPVRVEPVATPRSQRRATAGADAAFHLDQFAVRSGNKDGAAQHDHYIYGSKKRAVKKSARRGAKRS